MENWQKNYLEVICNFKNNLCGYMTLEELKELINIIFGIDVIKINDVLLEGYLTIINDFVESDNQKEFIRVFENIKNNYV